MSILIPFSINCIIILPLFFFLHYFTTTPATCLNNETDFQSFLAFKKAIVSDPQRALNTWNDTLHFCSWEGILCSKKHPGRVVSINLMSQGIIGSLSPHIGNLSFLTNISIHNNTFSGPIPDEIGHLTRLKYFDLSENLFFGPIPSFLGELNLEYLNLSFNLLEGEVPSIGHFRNKCVVSLEGNRNLCGGTEILKPPPCSTKTSIKKHHFSRRLQILIPMGVLVICVVLSAFSFYIFIYKKREPVNTESATHLAAVLRLSYGDLLKATGGFSEENLLGVGGSGSVYKGVLEEGQHIVAVKVINLSTEGASKSFMSERTVVRDIRHRNLVKILSVCSSTDFKGNDFKALVYKFVANGNLDDWLHQKLDKERQHSGGRRSLSLRQRLSIVVDVACAVEYLHYCGKGSIIVHGDLKPSNILLDENMTAHVWDYGLANVFKEVSSHHESSSIGIRGTLGYTPPEYGTSNKVSAEGDVYSYGILLMEIFTGRRPTDDTFENYLTLHDFVRSTLPSEGEKILDPVILLEQNHKKDKFKDGITSLFEIALACTMEVPKDRMLMGDIVKDLQKIFNTFK